MLDKLRRRGRWDWDMAERPFFTPKHIRWASHVGRPKWSPEQEQQKHDQKAKPRESAEENGFELSQREKEWKEHMEALRKRIHQDPYEAVFGRRFEPFWSPLVPSWMKEEMGLKDWYKPKDTSEAKATTSAFAKAYNIDTAKAPYRPLEPEAVPVKRQVDPASGSSEPQSTPARYTYDPKKTSVDFSSDTPNGQQTSYSYGSTTSWDSWTKKASRVEWDSASGEKRRFEYDPISNRMVQVKGPPESEVKKVEDALKDYPIKSPSPLMSHGWQSGLGSKSSDAAAVDIPVKVAKADRKAISVPTQDSTGRRTSVYFPSLINTSIVAGAPKPSSLTKHERYPDALTASDVRASVGQRRAEKSAVPAHSIVTEDRAYRHGKPDPRKMSEWDQAEHRVMLSQELYDVTKQKQKLLKQESGSFHIERIQRELAKLEVRASELHRELDAMDATAANVVTAASQSTQVPLEEMGCNDMMIASLDTSKMPARTAGASDKKVASPAPTKLQLAMERMQKKAAPAIEELDDSAAHESTGDFGEYKTTVSAKNFTKPVAMTPADRAQKSLDLQEALAQAENDALRKSGTSMVERLRERRSLEDRVQGDVLGRKSAPRWIDIMNARRAAYETKKAEESAAVNARDAEKKARLAKANALLQTEIDEQKSRMTAHEHDHPSPAIPFQAKPAQAPPSTISNSSESQRYQDKIRDLRKELDLAYKQSSTNAEGHVDTIRKLEKKLQTSVEPDAEKKKYIKKIKALREELDNSFKQSSINAEMQVDRIRELEKALEQARKPSKGVESIQAEGDMSANVTKFARESSRWYKQQASVHAKGLQELERELKSENNSRDTALSQHELRAGSAYEQKASQVKQEADSTKTAQHPIDQALAEYERRAAQKKRDRALVNEVRNIYENAYGAIDVHHRQESVAEALESDGKAQSGQKLAPQVVDEIETDVDLGKALADYEKDQKYEAKRDSLEAEIAQQERAAHEAQSVIDSEVHATRSVDNDVQHPIHAEAKQSLQWEEPPVYKVLAYDSGNDFLVTSTTSTNFTGKETPISIPEALSRLYQPARFIPEFAELQKKGFQVIYGTKDLLVLRKAKSSDPAAEKASPALADHGLISSSSSEPTTANSAPKVNPVDKTGYQEPATGSFASPTGFVGDRWESDQHSFRDQDQDNIDIKHYPRITRQEQVFSGSRLKTSSPSSKKDGRSKNEEKEQRRKYRSWRRSAKWALFSGVGAGAAAYGIGAAAERSREKDMERWQRILAEQRALGGLGADGKRLQQGGSGVFWR
ncbi:hypothetical protein Slin15195_G079540 [Septoria linicola]|uniref:Uncharacterized protein n=1 Tax=Septoria linicola TaxID=215465 RepID=A0A9Q9AT37_9PEZI|nr:hypothetical protein Slin14017_G040740 [Septoria linicola]USW54635.1 hypothetical protein Slin15195_G079540 [Septoria linicola]